MMKVEKDYLFSLCTLDTLPLPLKLTCQLSSCQLCWQFSLLISLLSDCNYLSTVNFLIALKRECALQRQLTFFFIGDKYEMAWNLSSK